MVAAGEYAERFALKNQAPILQIVPQKPEVLDGVGDYALRLAQQLQCDYAIETKFVAPRDLAKGNEWPNCSAIILHYVNYGYHPRGVPKQLPSLVRELKQKTGANLLTIFHELYASGPPWRSAFWLQPVQKSIAHKIARASDACIVSSETMCTMLRRLLPTAKVLVHPVVSNLSTPRFSSDQFVRRDPHCWVIFGGTELVERSLRSFRTRLSLILDAFSPRKLFVIGGAENDAVRAQLKEMTDLTSQYHPRLEAAAASEILSSCSFGWLDYFRERNVPTDAILKSGSFASYCAHGVVPVLPEPGSPIALRGDEMCGPFFVSAAGSNLPLPTDRAKIAAAIYEWYQRHAAIEHLARAVVTSLEIKS